MKFICTQYSLWLKWMIFNLNNYGYCLFELCIAHVHVSLMYMYMYGMYQCKLKCFKLTFLLPEIRYYIIINYCYSKMAKKMVRKIGSKFDTQPSTPSISSDDESLLGGSQSGGKLSVRKETEQRRRNLMNQHFDELVMMLTMITDRVTPKKMDKTSILEEVVRVLKQYYDLDKSPKLEYNPEYKPGFISRGELFTFLLDSLGAFLMFVSDNGRILYCSDLITSLTGHLPTRLVGQTIYDCVIPEDESTIRSQFNAPPDTTGKLILNSPLLSYPPSKFNCSFRLYSNDPSADIISRKFVCLSYLRQWRAVEEMMSDASDDMSNEYSNRSCILLVGKLSDCEWPRDSSITTNDVNFEFSVRVSKQGKILEVDKQASLVLGYTKSDIQGASFFDYIDPYHSIKVGEAIETFLTKGLGVSQPYRLLSKSGQYIWVVSKGFLSYNPWNHKPDHVLLENRVLGCDEILPEYKFKVDMKAMPNPNEDYDPIQLMTDDTVPKEAERPQSLPTSRMNVPMMSAVNNDTPVLMSTNSITTPLSSQQDTSLFSSLSSSNSILTPTLASVPITNDNSMEKMDDMVHQLQRKNQELFDLQSRMLEQQRLFEQERRQFYQVTNRIMTYIGKEDGVNVQSYIDPNMSMAIGNAGQHQSPSHISGDLPTSIDKNNGYSQQFIPSASVSGVSHTYTTQYSQPTFSQMQPPLYSQPQYTNNQFPHPQTTQQTYTQLPPQFSQNSQTQEMYSNNYSLPKSMPPTCVPSHNPYNQYGNMTTESSPYQNPSLHSYSSNNSDNNSNMDISQTGSSFAYCHQVPQ